MPQEITNNERKIKMLKKQKMLMILSVAFLTLSLSACGTINGAGQDIEAAGEAVQDAAN